ncbi:unnamed protein product [Symbiodinium sp. CCMP2592]|nr:unnamed protein product [Symbiodinium sp. CCMP2592]
MALGQQQATERMEEDAQAEEGKDGSPQKRGRVQEQPLTLSMLKEVLAAERQADRHHLAENLERMQGDFRDMRSRVDSVEKGITDNYDEQAKAIGQVQAEQKAIQQRLEQLQQRCRLTWGTCLFPAYAGDMQLSLSDNGGWRQKKSDAAEYNKQFNESATQT